MLTYQFYVARSLSFVFIHSWTCSHGTCRRDKVKLCRAPQLLQLHVVSYCIFVLVRNYRCFLSSCTPAFQFPFTPPLPHFSSVILVDDLPPLTLKLGFTFTKNKTKIKQHFLVFIASVLVLGRLTGYRACICCHVRKIEYSGLTPLWYGVIRCNLAIGK